jgi:hypothetical protein
MPVKFQENTERELARVTEYQITPCAFFGSSSTNNKPVLLIRKCRLSNVPSIEERKAKLVSCPRNRRFFAGNLTLPVGCFVYRNDMSD